jgi:hypothetical protein
MEVTLLLDFQISSLGDEKEGKQVRKLAIDEKTLKKTYLK